LLSTFRRCELEPIQRNGPETILILPKSRRVEALGLPCNVIAPGP
jgi:hypothetical protein